MTRFPIVTLLIPLLCSNAVAQSADSGRSPRTYATLRAARELPSFKMQGEYSGDRLGVQVVSLGEGQYRVVRYQGGLPGAGWNSTDRQVTEGNAGDVEAVVSELKQISRKSPTLGKEAPKGAVVLFDGTKKSLDDHWNDGATMTGNGLLEEGCTSRDTFGDFSAHVEFRLPFMPEARGQKRGNSGAYWQGRYETQMLDSFGLDGADNECGGLYQIAAPRINMCFPPLRWQTYDVDFTAADYDDQGNKVSNARITVYLNGVLVHDDVELPNSTRAAPRKERDTPGPLYLQDHGNPVRFRNIWVLPRS